MKLFIVLLCLGLARVWSLAQAADAVTEPLDFRYVAQPSSLAGCVQWSLFMSERSVWMARVTVPHGLCIVMDHAKPTLDFRDGLDIRGRLVFPEDYSLTVISTMIVVQGELVIERTDEGVDGTPLVRFVMEGDTDQTFTTRGTRNTNACNGSSECNAGKKGIVVAGGKLTVHGLPHNCPTWIRLYDVVGQDDKVSSALVVPHSVKNKWLAGAEILITSHTVDWDGGQVRTIVGTSGQYTRRAGYVVLNLNETIARPTTTRDSRDFAVEVALLSRNVVFDANIGFPPNHGGHLMIMNTPRVAQTLMGVEFVNFGQQGVLGRYPIHFHFCGDMSRSLVSKNSIRQSFQRCIVVHGTDNLLVEENVAYDTAGHCYMLEDGIETGNKFIGNLGARTRAPVVVIPNEGSNGRETDKEIPSTYWAPNPSNTWLDNVAAGSQGSGYWLELKLRGIRAHLFSHIDPKTDPFVLFKSNTAHSNQNVGIRTYPGGYNPLVVQTMSGLKAYRNNRAGIFFHNSNNIQVTQSLVADNKHIGIDIDRASAIKIRRSTIVGESSSYRNLMEQQDVANLCVFDRNFGIELHSWTPYPVGDVTLIESVDIVGFEQSACGGGSPLNLDKHINTGFFDGYTAFRDVSIENGLKVISFCDAQDEGVADIYFVDADGSLAPGSNNAERASALISDEPSMLQFVDQSKCTRVSSRCYLYCQRTCIRSIRYEVSPAGTADYKLRVCVSRNNCIFISGSRIQDDTDPLQDTPRAFVAHVPAGKYTAVFLDRSGEKVWPLFVNQYDVPSICEDSLTVDLDESASRSRSCDSLLQNGNMERSQTTPDYWMQRNCKIEIVRKAGVDGTNAVATLGNYASAMIVQYIDSGCLELHFGQWYELKADIKSFSCDPEKAKCPDMGLFFTNSGSEDVFRRVALISSVVSNQGYQRALDFVKVDREIQSASGVRFSVRSNTNKSILVDNASMRLIDDPNKYCQNVMRPWEGMLSEGWQVDREGKIIDDSFAKRKTFSDGITYIGLRSIETACFTRGTSWTISAELQMVNSRTGEHSVCDTSKDCPAVRLIVKDNNGVRVLNVKSRDYVSQEWIGKPKTFNVLRTTIALRNTCDWDGIPGSILLSVRDFDASYDLIIGDVSMKLVTTD